MISSFGPGNIEGLYLIPFDKGHYNIKWSWTGGVDDFRSLKIPTGYGIFRNVILDVNGTLRARPQIRISSHVTTPFTKKMKFIFSLAHVDVVGWDGENVKYGSGIGSWFDVVDATGNPLPLVTNIIIGSQSYAPIFYGGNYHLFATTTMPHSGATSYRSCIDFYTPGSLTSPKWRPTVWDEKIQVVGTDENRIFYGVEDTDGPIIRYSERQDPDTVGELSWWYLPNSNERFADIINIGNTLYVITAGGTDIAPGISIYKKVLMGKSDDLIDMTSMSGVFSNADIAFYAAQSNPKNGICTCQGSIYIATQQFGLCQVTDQGLLALGGPIIGDFKGREATGGLGDYILASDEKYGLVLCGRYRKGMTHVFDVVRRVWYEWNDFEIACKGYGCPERQKFGAKLTNAYIPQTGTVNVPAGSYVPMWLGDLYTPESASYYPDIDAEYSTGQLDFGHPFTEKQLRHLYIDGAGIHEVNIYSRDNIGEAFTLLHTISSPDEDITGYIPIDSQHRWKEIYIQLQGDCLFKLQHLAAGVVTLRDYQWGF